jgi:hypothetical protein
MLRRYVGRSWPIVLSKGLLGTQALVNQSRWRGKRGEQAAFVRRLALFPALYLQLKPRLGTEQALVALRQMMVTIGVREVNGILQSLTDHPTDPMNRLLAFSEVAQRESPNKFFLSTIVELTPDRLHYQITGCFVHEFFTDIGMPELTSLFCDIDEEFYPSAFPELHFHRDGDMAHTIGRGHPVCDFVLDRKDNVS